VKDGRRIELHYNGDDYEGQVVDYHPADSKRASQKWKLVYADKMTGIKTEGEARGFKIGKPFYL